MKIRLRLRSLSRLWILIALISPRKRKRDKATLLYTGELGAPNPMWKEKLFEEQEINMSVDGGYLPYKMDGLLEGKDNAAFLGDDMTGGGKGHYRTIQYFLFK